ncbi:cytochrome P450 [Lactarius indigo]|nr:cytochrome P450 [Lactarius indigo]
MLKEGYEETQPGLFKIATLWTWTVFATSPALIDDVRKAPDDVLCRRRPTEEFIQTNYTLDFLNKDDHYHGHVILSKLTRITSTVFKDIYEELVLALEDNIPTTGKEWVDVPALETIQRVICRVSNRVFVGAPLCAPQSLTIRTLNLNFAINVMKFATIIRVFPEFLKPLVMRIISNLPSQIQREMEFIRPMYEERLAKMEELGEEKWDDGPWGSSVWYYVRSHSPTALPSLRVHLWPAPLSAIHTDEEIYSEPDEFDGFRFARLRESSEGLMASRYQAGVTSPTHLSFGHGRHACPGRFFAATELKVMLARIVVTYDFKLEEGKEVPRDLCIGPSRIPRDARVLFRKRQN